MGAKSHAKIPAGKKQMLSILPIDLIKVVKFAAIEDGLRVGISWQAEDEEADQVRVIAPTA